MGSIHHLFTVSFCNSLRRYSLALSSRLWYNWLSETGIGQAKAPAGSYRGLGESASADGAVGVD